MLPAFTCASVIGKLESICLRVNILSYSTCVVSIGNVTLLKAIRVSYGPS